MDGKLRNMASVYIVCKERILLLYRQGGRVVNNVWVASAGGHFEEFELNDARACILREMKEELGLGEEDSQNLALRYITLRMTNGEIRQNYYFFADLKENINEDLVSCEGQVKWFSVDEITDLEMPHTARYVVNHYCSVGKFTNKLYVGATNEKGVEFVELPEC